MSLTVEDKPCWTVTCDVCGEGDGGDDPVSHFHYPTADEARKAVRGMDWWESKDGKHACYGCVEGGVDEIACPKCDAASDEPCRIESEPPFSWQAPCDERIAAWFAARPQDGGQ